MQTSAPPKKPRVKKLVPQIPFPIMRSLVEVYYDFQDQRIITASRIQMNSERNGITDKDLDTYGVSELFKKAESFENDIKRMLGAQMGYYNIRAEYLSHIYGIGPIITSGLIAYIADISRFKSISSLWQYAGFGMNTFCSKCEKPTYRDVIFTKDNKETTKAKRLQPFKKCPECDSDTIPIIQRRQIGYLSNWNAKMKVLCWKIGQSFEKQGSKSGYYKIYKQIKEKDRKLHPDRIKENGRIKFNDGHIRNRALRQVIKIFLAHLWVTWRSLEDLEVSEPYVHTLLGHNYIKPFMDKK